MFNTLNITVMNDAKTGSILNHNWDVVIEESIGKSFSFVLNFICSQKIDNGYIIFAKVIKYENIYPFLMLLSF